METFNNNSSVLLPYPPLRPPNYSTTTSLTVLLTISGLTLLWCMACLIKKIAETAKEREHGATQGESSASPSLSEDSGYDSNSHQHNNKEGHDVSEPRTGRELLHSLSFP